MATKRHNVPQYMKNTKKSAGYMAKQIFYTSMPSLNSTIVSTKAAYEDIRNFATKERGRMNIQKKFQARSLLRPVKEIIDNAKSDIKTGKFYNEERIDQAYSESMSDFLGEMSGDNEGVSESNESMSMAPFDKILSSSSAHSLSSAKAVSETQIKSTEYLGELQQTQHIQNLVMTQKHHLEHMSRLDNLEKLGTSLVEFNVKTMNEHIKATHSFYDEILNETRELRNQINQISNDITSRYKPSGRNKVKKNLLGDIFGSGAFDLGAYKNIVKNNIADSLPMSGDMMKELFNGFKASPISSMAMLASSFLIPKGFQKGAGKLDKSIQGVFAKYLQMMSNWKAGKTNGKMDWLKQILGNYLSVDMNANPKPDLSQYKNQAITLEIEQKKAKAITEVIPQYLSEITNKLTGKNMYFNYDKGMFEDRDTARGKLDKDKKSSVVYSMNETKQFFDQRVKSVSDDFKLDAASKAVLYEDVDNFVFWLATNGTEFNPKSKKSDADYYRELMKFGLRLKGGLNSYKILKTMYLKSSAAQRSGIDAERVNANAMSRDILQRFNESIINSGASSLYNGMDTLPKEVAGSINLKGKSINDFVSYFAAYTGMSKEEYAKWQKEQEDIRNERLNIDKKNNVTAGVSDKAKSFMGKTVDKLGLSDVFGTIKGVFEGVSEAVEKTLNMVSDKISSGVENLYNDDAQDSFEDFEYEDTASDVKAKAKKVSAKVMNAAKPKKAKVSKSSGGSKVIRNMIQSTIDYRPYFDTLDSHLRNIATLTEKNSSVTISYGQAGMPVLVENVSGLFAQGSRPDGVSSPDTTENKNSGLNTLKTAFRKAIDNGKEVAGKAGGTIRGKASELWNKAKSKGMDIAKSIFSGIKEYGGNVTEYFKSDKFKETIGGVKNSIKGGFNTAKSFAGTLFGSLKSLTKGAMNKGKGIAIGSMISNVLGLGPVPGAIIGALFSKKKKTESPEDKEATENIEKSEKGEGFFEKFKGKKKKSVLMGSAVSSLLGLGPVPGAVLTMIWNKKFVKKKTDDEDKEAQEMSDSVENAEKQAKGLSKFKKGKNLVGGAAISSLLGLGPMPGIITASIYNKYKDKALKKKNAEDQKEGDETAKAMDDATNPKEGILSKVKRFLGKGKNLALGAAASSLLGLGPIPGIVVASMYNKKKYKKKAAEQEEEQVTEDTLKDTVDETANEEINKTSAKNASKHSRKKKKKNKKAMQDAERMYNAEAKGNQKEADRLEKQGINKAKATGDVDELDKTSSIVANMRNSVTGSPSGKSDEEAKNPEKKNIFDSLKGILGGLGNILSFLGPVGIGLMGLFGAKGIKDWIKYMKEHGAGGHDTENEQGDSNFGNWTDSVNQGANAVGTLAGGTIIGKIGKLASKTLGIQSGKLISSAGINPGIGASFMGMTQSFNTADYYKNEQEAYNDRGADTLGQEASGLKWQNRAKGVWYGVKFAKSAGKIAAKAGQKLSTTGLGSKLVAWATKLVKSPKILKFFEKTGLKKAPEAVINFFKKNAGKIMTKVSTKCPSILGKIATKIGSIVSVVAAWLPLITAIAAFIRGWNNAARDLGMDPDSKIFIRARIANALVYALDDVLCGVLDIIGIRDWLTQQFTNLLLSDEEEKQLQESQSSQLNKYEKFIKENDLNKEGFTFDMYNKMTNKSIWGNVKSWFGADDLSKYKSGGKENSKLKEKYGGYTQNVYNYDGSEHTNVMFQDGTSTGSGGRGPNLAKNPNSAIKYARDKLSSAYYSGNATEITDKDVDKVQQAAQSPNKSNNDDKSGSFFSNIGKALSSAGEWVKNKAMGFLDWIAGWFGSGGRGSTSDPNYYNQADPRWANQSFGKYGGKRDTVKAGGCGPTVAAMALQQLSGNKVLPSTMANLALQAGYKVDDGGTSPEFFNTAGSMYGYNFNTESGITKDTVSALKAGIPVPLLGKSGPYGNGSHYLLANKIDSSGNVSVLDPQNKSNNKKYPINVLAGTTNASMVASPTIGRAYSKNKNNRYVQRVKSIGRGPNFGPDTEIYATDKELRKAKRFGRRRYGRGVSITQSPISSSNYESRQSRDIKYIVIHYAANFDGKAAGSVNWYNGKKASAHYAVGTDGIFQTVADNNIAWHCGDGVNATGKSFGGASVNGVCTNSNSIGIEIASNSSTTDYSGPYWFEDAALNNAVALTNELMAKYNIPKDHVVRHFDVSGKACPAPMAPKAYVEKSMKVASNHDDTAWSKFKNRLSGAASSKASVGECLVQGMAALEGKLSYSQSQRDVAKGSSDCSGTVQWVYKKVCGVDPGGNTSVMKTKGTQILSSTSDANKVIGSAQPGDLLLFSGHVEMYAGNGQCWGHGGGANGTVPGTRKSSVTGYMSSSGACEVRRYVTGSEKINTDLGTITDKDGNSVAIKISGSSSGNVFTSGSTESGQQTLIQQVLGAITTDSESGFYKTADSIIVDEDSQYGKTKSALSNLLGTVTASAASSGSYGNTGAAPGGTSRLGTHTLPANLGSAPTYMGWQMITSKSSNQYKLREAAGMNFDSEGYGKIGDRYVVATTSTFGNVGDYLTVKYADGTEMKAIIGDIKNQNDAGCTKWGHNNGASVVEFVGDKDSWYGKKSNTSLPHSGTAVSTITNEGNYWGSGGRGTSSTSVLPYKIKSTINSQTSTPFANGLLGRSGGLKGPSTPLPTKSIVAYDDAKTIAEKIKLQKRHGTTGRGIIDSGIKSLTEINTPAISTKDVGIDNKITTILTSIVELLTDLKNSNNAIAQKNFSPNVVVPNNSTPQQLSFGNQKVSIVDNIISGL